MTILTGIVWVVAWSLTASVAALITTLIIWHVPGAIRELYRDWRRERQHPTIHHNRQDGPVEIDPEAGHHIIITGTNPEQDTK
jgi:hypothetical protein